MEYLKNNESMDKQNAEAGYMPSNAEENYEFNSKTKIPDDQCIGYIDGNRKNWKFVNLKLVAKGTQEIEDAKKADKARKELDKQAKEKAEIKDAKEEINKKEDTKKDANKK